MRTLWVYYVDFHTHRGDEGSCCYIDGTTSPVCFEFFGRSDDFCSSGEGYSGFSGKWKQRFASVYLVIGFAAMMILDMAFG